MTLGVLRQLLLGFEAAIHTVFWQPLMLVLAACRCLKCLVQSWPFLLDSAMAGAMRQLFLAFAAVVWAQFWQLSMLVLAAVESLVQSWPSLVAWAMLGALRQLLLAFAAATLCAFLPTVDDASSSCGLGGVLGAVLAFFGGLSNVGGPAAALAWLCSCNSRRRSALESPPPGNIVAQNPKMGVSSTSAEEKDQETIEIRSKPHHHSFSSQGQQDVPQIVRKPCADRATQQLDKAEKKSMNDGNAALCTLTLNVHFRSPNC